MENTPDPRDPNERWLELEDMFHDNVPHSGSSHIPESMREKPAKEGDFDNTPLNQPANDGVLDAPDSPATLPENMPNMGESHQADKKTHPISWRNKLSTKIAAGVLAGAALVGARALATSDGNETSSEAAVTEEPGNDQDEPEAPRTRDGEEPLVTWDDDSDSSKESSNDAYSGETIVASPEFTPVLMDGVTVDKVMEQFTHNLNCRNAPVEDQFRDCINYITGGVDSGGGGVTGGLLGSAYEVYYYRNSTDPTYSFVSEFEIIDSDYEQGQPIPSGAHELRVVARETQILDGAEYNDTEERIVRLRFRPGTITTTTQEAAVEDSVEEKATWLLQSMRTIEPGSSETRLD